MGMSKVFQFSTISALMSGFMSGEFKLDGCNNDKLFGIGCSCELNGELTIVKGNVWEATAGESVHILHNKLVPFVQVTDFEIENSFECFNIDEKNMPSIFDGEVNSKNFFVAVNVHAKFERIKVRRPQRSSSKVRSILDVSNSQEVSTYIDISGQLIGFWTPDVYGRISVPGFHFHFLSDDKTKSGHVLSYKARKALVHYQMKDTIEIKNPSSDEYKNMNIDLNSIDSLIEKVEK